MVKLKVIELIKLDEVSSLCRMYDKSLRHSIGEPTSKRCFDEKQVFPEIVFVRQIGCKRDLVHVTFRLDNISLLITKPLHLLVHPALRNSNR